jgi:hypothetical protein
MLAEGQSKPIVVDLKHDKKMTLGIRRENNDLQGFKFDINPN